MSDLPVGPAINPIDRWRADGDAEVQQRAEPWFASARQLEDQGRFDEAFAHYVQGNRIKHESLDAPAWIAARAQGFRHLKQVFTPAFLASHAAPRGEDVAGGAAPIFIVGLPRSGSTLIEQILATHPQVRGMGECTALPEVTRTSYPFDLVGSFDPRAMARAYLSRVRAEGWRGEPRFTDKLLGNYTAIGHLHLMFPKAVILHTVREPADTCVSCFRLLFEHDPAARFAYDLADLGRYYRAYRELMDHWRAVLMGRVIDVRHEALVADPEGRIRWLLQVCGLPWDPRCLAFHDNPRDAKTASRLQVRQPIFTDGVGRWRRYAKHLRPLFDALGPYAPKDA